MRKNFHPCELFLFGSRATGKAKKNSDYDFLVISPQFRKWEWEERLAKVYFIKQHLPAAMDVVCLTPEEFKRKSKQLGIVQQAVKEGVRL
ncbi:nucleotidyltransferase domain-containing protein [Candidatus Woesearchaeota archaeon]|nr:nucleotidyltransferase domain-containing protein [Candidatus Woesearchaeota archaeon]